MGQLVNMSEFPCMTFLSFKNVISNLPLNVPILNRVCGYITMASLVKFRMNSEISMLSVCVCSHLILIDCDLAIFFTNDAHISYMNVSVFFQSSFRFK
jgi:hypothetical protein